MGAPLHSKKSNRLLIAAPADSVSRVHATFEGHYAYTIATSFAEACLRLNEGFDLICCGLDFDEGRMFDLLRYVKAHTSTKTLPFLCIKTNEGMLSPAILQSVEIASSALGAAGFVELYEWRKELGDEAAFERLRQLISRLVGTSQL